MSLTTATSKRTINIESADSLFSASRAGKLLMCLFLAAMAFCWSPGSLRAGEAEDFYKFYSFYQAKWQVVEETGGKKDTFTAECSGSAGGCNIFVSKKETSVWGYDPKTRQWTGVGQLDNGTRYVMAISRPPGPKFIPGMVFTFKGTFWHADGKVNYVTIKSICENENTLRGVVTGTDQDGKAIPKVFRTLTRIK